MLHALVNRRRAVKAASLNVERSGPSADNGKPFSVREDSRRVVKAVVKDDAKSNPCEAFERELRQ